MKTWMMLTVLLLTFSEITYAESNERPFYFNGGYRITRGPDYTLNRLYVGVGYQRKHYAAEAEIGTGFIDDTVRGVDVDSRFGYGLYVLGRYPFGRIGSDFFVRLGYEDLGVETSGGSLGDDDELKGVAYGFGFHVFKFRWGGLRLEYTGTEGDANSLSGAYVLGF